MADTLHLTRRKDVWYYRRRVPEHLVAAIGRKVIQLSLGTQDKAEAKKLRAIQDTRCDALFEAAEGGAPPTPGVKGILAALSRHQMVELVRDYVDRNHRQFLERLRSDPPKDRDELEEMQWDAGMCYDILRNPGDPRREELVDGTSAEILECSVAQIGFEPEKSELVWRGLLELSRRKLAQYANDFERPNFDELFGPRRASEITFGELSQQYLHQEIEDAELNGAAMKWTDKVRANVSLVREIVGGETRLSEIDYDACRHVASILARTPSNRTKFYPTLTLKRAIERGSVEGRPVLSVTTQGQYLATLKDILELATLKRLIPHNPARTLRPLKRDRVSDGEKRQSFSLDQLSAIFTSDFFRRCAPGAALPYSKPDRHWRFWLPLICLFMGMRPNEVCQLTVRDLRSTKGGTVYLEVISTSDGSEGLAPNAGKTIKTAASRRRIPVHPELIAIGFLGFVERRRKSDGEDARLLPGLKADKHGNMATYALKRFRDSFLPEVVTVGKRQSFYSLRHSFRDALRRCDAPPATLQALGGWSQGKLTSDSYGDQFDPDYQRQWIEQVEFPGLDLDFLHQHDGVLEHAGSEAHADSSAHG